MVILAVRLRRCNGSSSGASSTSHASMYTTSSKVMGDMLALGGAFMYAMSNVLQVGVGEGVGEICVIL